MPQDDPINVLRHFEEPGDFSLVLGGPLYQFLVRMGIVRPPLGRYFRRIVVITAIAWLPLLLLSMLDGSSLVGVQVPFFFDLDTHARFLGSVPLLIAAELIVHQRMRTIVRQFIDRDIVAPAEYPRLEGIIEYILRLRNSAIVEVLLIAFVFTGGHWIWHEHIRLDVATWYAAKVDGQVQLSLAGYWYAYVSLPIVQFIAFRWWFRWFLWCLFLWKVSRLRLRLNALHPDRAGGLGFLANSVFAFAPVLVAHTVFLAGFIGNQIWHTDAVLTDFKLEIAGLLISLMLLALAPLCFFVFHLANTKLSGMLEYGNLASRYVNDFRHKWIEAKATNEAMLGAADIQSLADLSNSFNVVQEMRLLPFGRQTIFRLAIILALPLFPLTLTMIPLEEMIDRMFGVFF